MDDLKTHLSSEELALAAEYLQKHQALPDAIQMHINNCMSCKYEVMAVLELSNSDSAQPQIVFWKSRKWIIGTAAIALILLTVGVYWAIAPQRNNQIQLASEVETLENDNRKPVSTQLDKVQTPSEDHKKVVLAQANYTPDPNLEQLVARYQTQLRSGETSPVVVEKLARKIRFSWKADGLLSFEIFDNKGILLKSWETNKQFVDYQTEKPGLYYFKLINEDFDLLWCGKFEAP